MGKNKKKVSANTNPKPVNSKVPVKASNSGKNTASGKSSGLDKLSWIIAVVIVAAAIAANYYFSEAPWAIKALGWIVVAGIVVVLVMLTQQGKALWKFMKESRIEMRKVVWPKREETVRTTAIVAVLVVATALLLWGADSILLWLIGLLTGQRG